MTTHTMPAMTTVSGGALRTGEVGTTVAESLRAAGAAVARRVRARWHDPLGMGASIAAALDDAFARFSAEQR
ncbi:hypothetical protein GCM10025789_05130 [Tessaracoccus lubricantis]|uniref:Uncharacterized protein n=1 Tax=Tessaracoccus lubricantis TaxID=545543 RepID=A0ABP9F3F3_9ACTN